MTATAPGQTPTDPEAAPADLSARLADVRVSVRPDLEVSRHSFGEAPAYVLRDPITNQTHQLTIEDYQVFAHIESHRTLGETFRVLSERGYVREADAAQFYRYVLHLQQVGLLALPVSDGKALHDRHAKRRQMAARLSISKLLFYRLPLVRPDAFLDRTVGIVAPLFTRTALVVWALLMAAAAAVVATHWADFSHPLSGMLATRNLPVLWVLLVGLKLLHEMGHAWACKRFGGDVPEMGAFFILGTPCAYVDATASWGFPSRAQRIVVALAGMYFESFATIAAIAVWLLTGPGIINSAAQYAVVLSTVVTIGFNANPLMRYDGYYVASDLLNIPNLRQTAQAEFMGRLKWLLFGVPMPTDRPKRRRTLLLWYGIGSRLYMTFVLIGIAWLVASCLPVVGPLVAALIVGGAAAKSLLGAWQYLRNHDELTRVRQRAWAVTFGGLAATAIVVGALPAPVGVDALGAVQRERERVVHAGVAGFLTSRLVECGQQVTPEHLVCEIANPDATAKVQQIEAETQSLRARMVAASGSPGEAARLAAELAGLASQRREAKRQAALTKALAEIDGQIVDTSSIQTLGRFVRVGEPLVTVGAGGWVVRCLLTDEGVSDSLPAVGDAVAVRLVGRPGVVLDAHVVSVRAAGSRQLDDATLTHLGGGDITVSEDLVADRAFFEVTAHVQRSGDAPLRRGMTAIVDFGGRSSTIASLLYRRCQQLLNRMRTQG